jgi:DNA-binding MarR family transcriptional regulator
MTLTSRVYRASKQPGLYPSGGDQMIEIEDLRKRYGIPQETKVHITDYSSIPTRDLLERISEHKRRILDFKDETLDEAIEVNELYAIEEELNRRTLLGEAVLGLNDDFASLMTSSRLKLLSFLRGSDARSVRELAEMLKRPEKSVSRDVEVLARYGLVNTTEVSDRRGRRREVRVGATKLILVPDGSRDSGS